MTICIAAICEDKYAIVTTDRMITVGRPSIEFETRRSKLEHLTDRCVAAIAGDALTPTDLFRKIRGELAESGTESVPQIVETTKRCYQQLRDQKINEEVLAPAGLTIQRFYEGQQMMQPQVVGALFQEMTTYKLGVLLLVAGVDASGPHIFRVDNPGTSAPFNAIGYNAIGSGEDHALTTFIAHNYESDISLEEGLFIVFKAKKSAEKASGVGEMTSIRIISDDAGIRSLTDDEIRTLHAVYEKDVKLRTERLQDIHKEIEALKLSEKSEVNED